MRFHLTTQETLFRQCDVERMEALGFALEHRQGLPCGCTHVVIEPVELFVGFDTIEQLVQFTIDNGGCVVMPPRMPGDLPTIHLAREHEAH